MDTEGFVVNRADPSAPMAGCPYHHSAPVHPIVAEALERGPVFFHPQMQVWVITNHADVVAVLKDNQRFSIIGAIDSASMFGPETLEVLRPVFPLFAHSLLSMDPPEHTRLRTLINKAFSPRQVARLEPDVRRIVDQTIDGLISEGQADLVEQLGKVVPFLVFSALLGLPEQDRTQIWRWTNDWMLLVMDLLPPEEQVPRAHSLVAYMRYIDALIEQRRAAPQDDFTSALIAAGEEGSIPLSAAELRDTINVLALAGIESTASMTGNLLHQLLADPRRWEHLRQHPQHIAQAVEEALRLEGVPIGVVRIAREDVTLRDVCIPRGATVMLMLSTANLDAEVFEQPAAFDMDRAGLARHLSFGSGVHYCLGAPLARLELQVIVERLLERMPSLRVSPGQTFSYRPIVRARGIERLLVEWDERPEERTV